MLRRMLLSSEMGGKGPFEYVETIEVEVKCRRADISIAAENGTAYVFIPTDDAAAKFVFLNVIDGKFGFSSYNEDSINGLYSENNYNVSDDGTVAFTARIGQNKVYTMQLDVYKYGYGG